MAEVVGLLNEDIIELCKYFRAYDEEKSTRSYEVACSKLLESHSESLEKCHFDIQQEIQSAFVKRKSEDGIKFRETFKRLMAIECPLSPNHRSKIAYCLYHLSDLKPQETTVDPTLESDYEAMSRQEVVKKLQDRVTIPASKVFSLPRFYEPFSGPVIMTPREKLEPSAVWRPAGRPMTPPPQPATQQKILQELFIIFKGNNGEIVKYDPETEHFVVNSEVDVPESTRVLIMELSQLGCYYLRLKKVVEANAALEEPIQQAYGTAIEEQLDEYLRLINQYEQQTKKKDLAALFHLSTISSDLLMRMHFLVSITERCQNLKGGAVAYTIYNYSLTGNVKLANTALIVLKKVSHPLYKMMVEWMCHGKLDPKWTEFFIEAHPNVPANSWWEQAYQLRPSKMLSFIPTDMAKKILTIGKSVDYLRKFCNTRTNMFHLFKDIRSRALYDPAYSDVFITPVNKAYKQIGQYLLVTLTRDFHLFEHMGAIRRFLLLGQGDFVRHLVDLVEVELNKPGVNVFRHTLLASLETAIRSSSVWKKDEHFLKRLDVCVLQDAEGETGWDLFCLDYHVDGPISMVLQPEYMQLYRTLSFALFKAKRMECMLTGVWKRYMNASRLLRCMPETLGVVHLVQLLGAEMLQLCNHMAYYMAFEVVECNWVELNRSLQEAHALDDIIDLQKKFIGKVFKGLFLREQQEGLLTHFRSIYDLIFKFVELVDKLLRKCEEEREERVEFDDLMNERIESNLYGVTAAEEEAEVRRRRDFTRLFLPQMDTEFKILTHRYQHTVRGFLTQLACQQDESLKGLSSRLDFSEYYRKQDPQLQVAYTYGYQKQTRMSLSLSESYMENKLGL